MPLHKNDPIIVEDYDSSWPLVFQKLSFILQKQLEGLILDIVHVGSTSVQGLAAKPLIDLIVVIESQDLFSEVSSLLSELGYCHKGDGGIVGREAFDREGADVPRDGKTHEWLDHHLYVCVKDSDELKRQIAFRDYLRQNEKAVQEYARLKKQLAKEFRDNRKSYTESKTDFINGIHAEIIKNNRFKS